MSTHYVMLSRTENTHYATLRRIEQFLRKTRMPYTKFGRLVANDPRLVGDLRNGRMLRPAMIARITEFLDKQ